MKSLLVASVFFWAAGLVKAEVPQPVTDECNDANAGSYYNMPNCLKEGAVAFEILNLALQENYYGPSAQKVIDGCRERNETFETVWICFENAAEKASETRQLIGVKNMQDQCYVAVSDPEILDRIKKAEKQSRKMYFGDEYSFGGGVYYPFRGCSESKPDPETGAEVNDTEGSSDGFSELACSAYKEIDNLLVSQSDTELEALFNAMNELPKDERLNSLSSTGVSRQSIEFIQNAGEEQAMATAILLAALMHKHHPLLLEQFIDSGGSPTNSVADQLGGSLVSGMFELALAGYDEQCVENVPR